MYFFYFICCLSLHISMFMSASGSRIPLYGHDIRDGCDDITQMM